MNTSHLFVKSFIDKISRDKLYNYSATAAFFIILSIFPFIILLLTLVQYTPLTEPFLIEQMGKIIPKVILPLLTQIVEEIYNLTWGKGIITVSALIAIWSASKGIMSLIRGINIAFNINDRRNYFRVRLLSCLYTIIAIVVISFVLILMVFGKTLYDTLKDNKSFVYDILRAILNQRVIITLIVLILLFMLIYKFFPAKQNRFLAMFPGSFICALAWFGLSKLAGLYIRFFPNFSYTYGSLTSFILLMLLMYFYMYIMFICAEINFFFKSWLDERYSKRQRRRAEKYENKMENKRIKKEIKENKKNDLH